MSYILFSEPQYPDSKNCFSPAKQYPEYPFSSLSEENILYDQMRTALYGMGLDEENYGNTDWNPFGAFISPGNTVLIKPNWVSHCNNNRDSDMECMVTHTSILRFTIDYCVIALKGQGQIIVGDAPIQAAKFPMILDALHIPNLTEFYRNNDVLVEIKDFRGQEESVFIDLGTKSAFMGKGANQRYHVMDYVEEQTQSFHHDAKHIYAINKAVFDADVIINLPKPKCHKLAGMTAAMKNMVGIVTEKRTLPHETIGTPDESGDSTSKNCLTSKLVYSLRHVAEKEKDAGHYRTEWLLRRCDSVARRVLRPFNKDLHLFGSWYKNDTIWRTVHDLNTIIVHYGKDFKYHEEPQRKLFAIADMIVAGEGEGPLAPSAKKTGIVLFGSDFIEMDTIAAGLMGFDQFKIPTLSNIKNLSTYLRREVHSNDPAYEGTHINEIKCPVVFEAHSGWKGHIEKKA